MLSSWYMLLFCPKNLFHRGTILLVKSEFYISSLYSHILPKLLFIYGPTICEGKVLSSKKPSTLSLILKNKDRSDFFVFCWSTAVLSSPLQPSRWLHKAWLHITKASHRQTVEKNSLQAPYSPRIIQKQRAERKIQVTVVRDARHTPPSQQATKKTLK